MKKIMHRQYQNFCSVPNPKDNSISDVENSADNSAHDSTDRLTENFVDKIHIKVIKTKIELNNKYINEAESFKHLKKLKIKKFGVTKNFYLNFNLVFNPILNPNFIRSFCQQIAWPDLCHVTDQITKPVFVPRPGPGMNKKGGKYVSQ